MGDTLHLPFRLAGVHRAHSSNPAVFPRPCHASVLRKGGSDMVRKVLVGTDTSASADLAVGVAADLARACAAPLVVLYVKPELDPREVFAPAGSASPADPAAYLEEVGRRFEDLQVATRQVPGDPATTICAVAE